MHIFSTIFDALPYILEGTFVTVLLVVGALFLGFCLGVPMAVTQVYGPKFASRLVGFYIWFFRGVPVLLLLFLFFIVTIKFIVLFFKLIISKNLISFI